MRPLALGTWNLAAAFALGAFGTHGLRASLTPDRLAVFQTGAAYHVYGSLALMALGAAAVYRPVALPRWTVLALLGGNLVFAGCLYALSLTGLRLFGAIVPVGGALMILSLAGAGLAAWRAAGPAIEKAPPS